MWVLINVFDIFYPKKCLGCDEILIAKNTIVCESCYLNLDIIPNSLSDDTEMKRRFYGKLPITYAIALLYYSENSITQKLLHQLKYHNRQDIGVFLAELLYHHIKNQPITKQIDCIICIPLHHKKEKERGYNQLQTFCTELSNKLNIPFFKDYLIKTNYGKTQTKKNIFQRAKSKTEYIVNKKHLPFKHQNFLLVDDVMTTGSTLQNAGKCILNSTQCTISILTMAYTR